MPKTKTSLKYKKTIENELLKHVDEKNIATIITEMIFYGWKWISEHMDMDFNYMVKHQKELYWALVLEKNKNLRVTAEERSILWEISSKNNYRYF